MSLQPSPSGRWGSAPAEKMYRAGFKKALRIMHGDMTAEIHEVHREWTERSALGKAWDSTKQTATSAARSAAEGMRAAGRGVATTMGRLSTTFANDPAILLGRDLVIYLWKE